MKTCKYCDEQMTDVSGSPLFPAEWECRNPKCEKSPAYQPAPTRPEMVDPYYMVDPTLPMPAPILSRSVGGKFAGYSTLAAMADEHCQPDSKRWAALARGAQKALLDAADPSIDPIEAIMGGFRIEFTWRMIAEMLEAACDVADKAPLDLDGMCRAAWDHLRVKQIETYKAEQERQAAEINEMQEWLETDGTQPSPIISGGEIIYRDTPSANVEFEIPF